MFADSAKIYIRSGKGGDGHVSFRRELFVAAGGPDGGDGGRGGDVIFEVDDGLNTLTDFRHVRKYVAGDGEQGGKRRCHGADGEDLIVKVPEGTVIKDFESGKVVADMSGENRREVILKGGKGGLGNMHFATSTMQVPKYAQPGQPAQELWVQLELKVIADVGLVGFPNVGKSTLLSRVSNARPKIANYHFTTLNPHLGVVDIDGGKGFVMADIPGLVEGAHEGTGLGLDFLKHVERTKVLIHVVDIAGSEGRDPIEDFDKINGELMKYSEKVLRKPQIVVGNKSDLIYDPEKAEEFRRYVESKGYPFFLMSAATSQGIKEVLSAAVQALSTVEEEEEPVEYLEEDFHGEDPDYREIYTYVDERDGAYVIEGKQLTKIFNSTNFNDMESLRYLYRYIEKKGAVAELKELGLEEGDIVRIKDYEFEYSEE